MLSGDLIIFFSLFIFQNINSEPNAWREARILFREKADTSTFSRLGQVAYQRYQCTQRFGDWADVKPEERLQRRRTHLKISRQGILRLWVLRKVDDKSPQLEDAGKYQRNTGADIVSSPPALALNAAWTRDCERGQLAEAIVLFRNSKGSTKQGLQGLKIFPNQSRRHREKVRTSLLCLIEFLLQGQVLFC